MSISKQIKKLDDDLNLCKVKISTLFQHNNLPEVNKKCCRSKMEKCPTKKKNFHEECIPDYRKKVQKTPRVQPKKMVVSHDIMKRPKNIDDNIITQIQMKGSVKPRSRSVCAKGDKLDEGTRKNNIYYSPRCRYSEEEYPIHKESWAHILKEHNNLRHKARFSDDELEDFRSRCREKVNYVTVPPPIVVKNRGIQCSEKVLSSATSGVSTNYHSALNFQTNSGFQPYNPARTLQFLVFEFKENLRNNSGDNKLYSILNDIEEIVSRLKFDPASCTTSLDPKPDPKQEYEDLREQLVNKYQRLEDTSKSLEILCTKLKEEKNLLLVELDAKKEALKSHECKENEYVNQISNLNSHIASLNQRSEKQVQSLYDLTKVVDKLQSDAKNFDALREQYGKMSVKLESAQAEMDRLYTEIQLIKLEKEKKDLLLDIKEQQLNRLREDLKNMGGYVSDELNSLHEKAVSGDDSSIDHTAPLCSSPNESYSCDKKRQNKSLCNSWKNYSSIHDDEFFREVVRCPSATPFVEHNVRAAVPGPSSFPKDVIQPKSRVESLKNELKALFVDLRKEARHISTPVENPKISSLSSTTDDDGDTEWKKMETMKSATAGTFQSMH